MSTGRRLLCVFALLCLLASGAAAQQVRVRMTRYETREAFALQISGRYLAGERVRLDVGAEAIVALTEGRLVLYVDHVAVDMGNKISLTRADEDASLLLGAGDGPFAGDLTLTCEDGVIRPVLSVELEDYVAGVVPYEMGDSFPLEALKAQAVAARTYALACLNSQSAYDVVDNTNDQVYRGPSQDDPLSMRAARETAGIVALIHGRPAVCYYTASNGGQTELGAVAWPKRKDRDYGYMEQKDDPYDIANPRSPVRRYTLLRQPEAGEATLALQQSMAGAMQAAGLSADTDCFRIDEVLSLEIVTKEGSASRVPAGLRLSARVSTREKIALRMAQSGEDGKEAVETQVGTAYMDYTPREEPITWETPFFGALERAFGLSINAADNEILTITENDAAFILETRRYGHGVGMSQRGAEQMADMGRTMEQILSFYYPGVTLTKLADTPQATPTVPAYLNATPPPTSSPTPRPTPMPVSTEDLPAGATLAEVGKISADSSLNLRQEPSLSAEILRRLYLGQPLIVLAQDADGWAHVRTDVIEGYVRSEYLVPPGEAETCRAADPS